MNFPKWWAPNLVSVPRKKKILYGLLAETIDFEKHTQLWKKYMDPLSSVWVTLNEKPPEIADAYWMTKEKCVILNIIYVYFVTMCSKISILQTF